MHDKVMYLKTGSILVFLFLFYLYDCNIAVVHPECTTQFTIVLLSVLMKIDGNEFVLTGVLEMFAVLVDC